MDYCYLQKKLSGWCKVHKDEKGELIGFLAEYGSVIPEQGTLGEILMGAYIQTASKRNTTVEHLIDWIFSPDDVDAVMLRIEVAT